MCRAEKEKAEEEAGPGGRTFLLLSRSASEKRETESDGERKEWSYFFPFSSMNESRRKAIARCVLECLPCVCM
jgi:hypothetical protein